MIVTGQYERVVRKKRKQREEREEREEQMITTYYKATKSTENYRLPPLASFAFFADNVYVLSRKPGCAKKSPRL